ncbi:hypothetical protein [Parasediminibacterium sp. JCM 36343]|uniref:hypothetical protein n=1 Tax=Parasediminibacterium sp. JCM 36343 TaxID=3374279 RepID=UPI0039789C63
MKQIFFLILCFTVIGSALAQPIAKENKLTLPQIEKKIKGYSYDMINADHWFMRFEADSLFTRGLVRALKMPYSFYYPFDSLTSISKLYAPDSSFRIFTWQMMKDYTYYRQRGAIQMRTPDGSLKLFPLFDVSDFTKAPGDSIRNIKNWIGAIYYKVLLNMDGNKKVYTLLGYDENGPRSNIKWIDILTFDENGIPHFGGNYFKFEPSDTSRQKGIAYRYGLEYKKEAKLRMLYDGETQMIVFDHLASESDEPESKYTYVPDGSYEAFKWENNHWGHVPKLATLSLGNGNAPLEAMILDENGNLDQKKLDEQSRRNMLLQQQESQQTTTEPKEPKKIKTTKKKSSQPPEGEY